MLVRLQPCGLQKRQFCDDESRHPVGAVDEFKITNALKKLQQKNAFQTLFYVLIPFVRQVHLTPLNGTSQPLNGNTVYHWKFRYGWKSCHLQCTLFPNGFDTHFNGIAHALQRHCSADVCLIAVSFKRACRYCVLPQSTNVLLANLSIYCECATILGALPKSLLPSA